jgi:predicted kinase
MRRVELHVTQGLSASGKSTWAKAWVAEDRRDTRVRMNRDDLRKMIRGHWTGNANDEDLISSMIDCGVRTALRSGLDVVIDNTHLDTRDLKWWLDVADDEDARTVIHVWTTRTAECVARNRIRTGGIPHDVILRQARKLARNKIGIDCLRSSFDEVVFHE